MKVLQPIATSQNLIIRPRANVSTVDLALRHILKDTTTTLSGIATSFANGLLTIPFSHDFTEGETYAVELTNNAYSSLVWRVQIFIPAQATQNYDIYT